MANVEERISEIEAAIQEAQWLRHVAVFRGNDEEDLENQIEKWLLVEAADGIDIRIDDVRLSVAMATLDTDTTVEMFCALILYSQRSEGGGDA